MPNLASIYLIGHLGRDMGELRHTADGTPVASNAVAVKTGWGDHQVTSWYDLSVFGKGAEAAMDIWRKGAPIAGLGEPSIREYTTKAGERRLSVRVRVQQWQILERRSDDDGGGDKQDATPDVVVPF